MADTEFIVGATIHIARNKADQENNFYYLERALRKRGVGHFKHCLGPCAVSVEQAEELIRSVVGTVMLGRDCWFEPFEEFER